MNYFEVYEAMYQNGYRDKRKCAGAEFLHYAFELLRF